MQAVIFCGGEVENYDYLKNMDLTDSCIICADSGVRHALKLNISPDLVVGDHDSWHGDYPNCAEVINCPTEKDYTDTSLCIDKAAEYGCEEILIIGGIGGRIDHEYSHLCLMAKALRRGVRVKLINEHNEIWMENKSFVLHRGKKRYVSFFPFGGDITEFSIHGLKYELDCVTLKCDEAAASSNEFGDRDAARIDFADGTLIVMLCDDK